MISLRFLENKGSLPTSTYELFDKDRKVGYFQLRHKPSKAESMPVGFENHIYYEIEESERGKGYATQGLKLVLEEAKKIGIREAVIVAEERNIASQKVIEKNGGAEVDRKPDSSGDIYIKYKIMLD